MSMYDLQPRTPPVPRPRRAPGDRIRFGRGFVSGLLAFVALAAFGLSAALIGYALIARTLPSPKRAACAGQLVSEHAHL